MINLLPPDVKSHYRFASRNTKLRRWVVALVVAIVGAAAIGVGGLLYLRQISSSYDQQVAAATESLKQQDLAGTRTEVNDISSSLKLSVQVLSKEVLFSKLLKQLATLTPSNVTLSSLNITQGATAIDIAANTTDYNAATQLQVNLADPQNEIFSKADIISISCGGSSTGGTTSTSSSKYPCAVTIRALFAKDNPFLFISNSNKVAS